MVHRAHDSDPFPERTPRGTRYDMEPRGPRRTRRLPPTVTLFQAHGAPRLVCFTWEERVRLYVAVFGQTGRSRVTELAVRRITVGDKQVTIHTDHGLVKVPKPGLKGMGTWEHEVLNPLVVANFDIERDATGKVVSVQPKGT